MLAADVYSAFQEAPSGGGGDHEEHQRAIGKRYKDTFMALGGGVHSREVFRRFRGRDPSMKALVKSLNLKAAKQEFIWARETRVEFEREERYTRPYFIIF